MWNGTQSQADQHRGREPEPTALNSLLNFIQQLQGKEEERKHLGIEVLFAELKWGKVKSSGSSTEAWIVKGLSTRSQVKRYRSGAEKVLQANPLSAVLTYHVGISSIPGYSTYFLAPCL